MYAILFGFIDSLKKRVEQLIFAKENLLLNHGGFAYAGAFSSFFTGRGSMRGCQQSISVQVINLFERRGNFFECIQDIRGKVSRHCPSVTPGNYPVTFLMVERRFIRPLAH